MGLKVIGWVCYDAFWFETAEGNEEEIGAVVEEIRQKGYKFGGDDHENMPNCCPLLSNGKAVRKSWRGWGAVMARAWDLRNEEGEYNYILWYMGEYGPEKRVMPETGANVDVFKGPKGKTVSYDIEEEEYHSFYYACFNTVVFPVSYYETIRLKTFDTVLFRYGGEMLLAGKVNELPFQYYDIEEFFKDTEFPPPDNTNFSGFNPESLRAFLRKKYGTEEERLVALVVNVFDDKRNGNDLYV